MARASLREKIVEAGLHTLHSQGFNGTGVQEITAAAGVPKGSFYNHFASKEALGVEALQRFWEGGAARRAILVDENVPPIERLRRHFRSLAEVVARYDYRKGCLIGNFSAELADQSQPVREGLAEIYANWSAMIETCVRAAQEAGEIRADLDAAKTAAFLVNAWEGVVLRTKVEKTSAPMDQFEDVVFAAIAT